MALWIWGVHLQACSLGWWLAVAVLVAPEASPLMPVGVLAAVDAHLCFG